MILRKQVSKAEVVLQASGSLNGETANEFIRHLEELAGGGQKTITLDLKEVSAINSACISRILLQRKKLAEADRTIRIQGCSEPLFTTFQLIRFDELLSIER